MVILNFLLRMVKCNQVIHCEKFPLEMLKSMQKIILKLFENLYSLKIFTIQIFKQVICFYWLSLSGNLVRTKRLYCGLAKSTF